MDVSRGFEVGNWNGEDGRNKYSSQDGGDGSNWDDCREGECNWDKKGCPWASRAERITLLNFPKLGSQIHQAKGYW